jgi:hypothetical protein
MGVQREENELRRSQGDPLLPEEDPTLPFFRPLPEQRTARDPLDLLLMSAQISSYCGQVNKASFRMNPYLTMACTLSSHAVLWHVFRQALPRQQLAQMSGSVP